MANGTTEKEVKKEVQKEGKEEYLRAACPRRTRVGSQVLVMDIPVPLTI